MDMVIANPIMRSICDISVSGLLFIMCLAFITPAGAADAPVNRTIVVTDALNRKVEIELPLQKVVTINSASLTILRALGVDVGKRVVAVTTYICENSRFWPELKNKPALNYKSLSYEILAELDPQVVFLYKSSPRFTNEEKMKALGVRWLYMDCFDPMTLDNDIKILGSLFGKEEEAGRLINWYQRYDRLISSRITGIDLKERPKVFYYQYPDVHLSRGVYNSINKYSSCHPLIAKAGGNNMAANLPREYMEVSAEWVMENNPEVIIASTLGSNFSGYNAKESKAVNNMRDLRQRLVNDKALKETDAVRNEKVFLLSQDLKNGPSYVIGLAYLAKYLYPGMFRDIEPESIAREYYETWCNLPYRGVYVYPPVESVAGPLKDVDPEKYHKEYFKTRFNVNYQGIWPYP